LLVPISLYVSMELVKFSQAWFIDQDISTHCGTAALRHSARHSAHSAKRRLARFLL
jgi:hypothetical protein